PATLARDRVDRARQLGILGRPVDQRHDPLLVGDRDIRAEEVVLADLADRVGELERGPIPLLVARVHAERIEGRLLHGAGERVGDGMADEHDPLRHADTAPSWPKKAGSEMAADAAPSTRVVPSAIRPALAN